MCLFHGIDFKSLWNECLLLFLNIISKRSYIFFYCVVIGADGSHLFFSNLFCAFRAGIKDVLANILNNPVHQCSLGFLKLGKSSAIEINFEWLTSCLVFGLMACHRNSPPSPRLRGAGISDGVRTPQYLVPSYRLAS